MSRLTRWVVHEVMVWGGRPLPLNWQEMSVDPTRLMGSATLSETQTARRAETCPSVEGVPAKLSFSGIDESRRCEVSRTAFASLSVSGRHGMFLPLPLPWRRVRIIFSRDSSKNLGAT